MTKKLTDKKLRFVEEYLTDLNGTQAAIRAGYSAKTARQIGARLLSDVDIQSAISRRRDALSKRTEVTQDRILLEIARLAFNDPRKAFDENGALLPIKDWPDEVAAAISSIKVTEETDAEGAVIGLTKEVKFWDKNKAIDMAGKHLGMFVERKELTGKDGMPLEPPNITMVVNRG